MPKSLRVRYKFRGREHYAEIPDYMPVVIPLKGTLCFPTQICATTLVGIKLAKRLLSLYVTEETLRGLDRSQPKMTLYLDADLLLSAVDHLVD